MIRTKLIDRFAKGYAEGLKCEGLSVLQAMFTPSERVVYKKALRLPLDDEEMEFLERCNSPQTNKRCTRCGKEFPITEYNINVARPDGHSIYCRNCACTIQKGYYRHKIMKKRGFIV